MELPPRTSIHYDSGSISFVDQRLLPGKFKVVNTTDFRVVGRAIKSLAIRGAPLIGVAAAMGVAVEARRVSKAGNVRKRSLLALEILIRTRPTAVNLFTVLNQMRAVIEASTDIDLADRIETEALRLWQDDKHRCDSIAQAGLPLIRSHANIVTICNTGYLATAGVGTALGVIYKAHDAGLVDNVFALETRPLLQGARLTAWEVSQAGVPVTLLSDGAVGSLLRRGSIDLAIIGADRIARNGDTANKIGSLQLALACHRFSVPLYVAAPATTFDPDIASGDEIVIEQRGHHEITHLGNRLITAKGIEAFNPAFDLVDADLISGIITDFGLFRPPFNFSSAFKN